MIQEARTLSPREIETVRIHMAVLDKEIQERTQELDPLRHSLPDLLFGRSELPLQPGRKPTTTPPTRAAMQCAPTRRRSIRGS